MSESQTGKSEPLSIGTLVGITTVWDERLDTWVDCPQTLALVVESYLDQEGNNLIHLHIPEADYTYDIPYYNNELEIIEAIDESI